METTVSGGGKGEGSRSLPLLFPVSTPARPPPVSLPRRPATRHPRTKPGAPSCPLPLRRPPNASSPPREAAPPAPAAFLRRVFPSRRDAAGLGCRSLPSPQPATPATSGGRSGGRSRKAKDGGCLCRRRRQPLCWPINPIPPAGQGERSGSTWNDWPGSTGSTKPSWGTGGRREALRRGRRRREEMEPPPLPLPPLQPPLLSSAAAALGAAVGWLSSLPPSLLTCGSRPVTPEGGASAGHRGREGGGVRAMAVVVALYRGLHRAHAAREGGRPLIGPLRLKAARPFRAGSG